MQQVPDIPTYAERAESFEQRHQEQLAFDVKDEALDQEIQKLMMELEDIQDSRAAEDIRRELNSILEFKDDFSPIDNWSAVQEQKRVLKKLA